MTQELHPRPFIDGIVWPAVPHQQAAGMLAMQFQLEQSQWLPPATLRLRQLDQAALLLHHALKTVPYYRDKYREVKLRPLDEALWRELPILERTEIQDHFDALRSSAVPEDHGRLISYGSSGSSGRPIKTLGTDVTHFFWQALSVRDHLWHRRDFTARHGAIRSKVEKSEGRGWGEWSAGLLTGPSCTLNIGEDLDTQLSWLQAEKPAYFITHPSNLAALARRALALGVRPEGLREVRTFGETLPADLRELCREAWDVELVDLYSAEELGYIALQCPDHEHYHVQAENLLVEVLNEQGEPCQPGEVGTVVVTTLHNFAMPLIRYRLRDYAEVGEPCSCGRGLPVLKRIVGRQRNMVVLPDGRRHWPSFPGQSWVDVTPKIRQFQLIQHDLSRIEAKVVCREPLTAGEEQGLQRMLAEKFGHPFDFDIQQVEGIEPRPNHKYEDFISHVAE